MNDAERAGTRTVRTRRPRLRADLTASSSGTGVVLVGERRSVSIDSPLLSQLLPVLDGRHDLAEICRAGGGVGVTAAVLGELNRLERHGLLVDGPVVGSDPSAQAATDLLDTARAGGPVDVVGLSASGPAEVLAALDAAGLDGSASAPGATPCDGALTLVVVDDYLDPRLAGINSAMLADRRPWMLVKPGGSASWIGPALVPGLTACWSCLADRLRRNSLRRPEDGPELVVARLPSTERAAAGLLATEVLRVTARLARATGTPVGDPLGRLLALDHVVPSVTSHPVARLAHCPSCGTMASPAASPLPPDPSAAVATGAEQGRRSAAETLAALRPAISPLTGLVTGLTEVREVIPELAYSAFASFHLVTPQGQTAAMQSGGKGRSPAAAQMSALGEALERAGGVWRPGTPVVRARWVDVADRAPWPPDLFGYSARQYEERTPVGPRGEGSFTAVPEPFDPQREIDWTEAKEPGSDECILVPSAYCYYGHPDAATQPWVYCDSNGTAAGGTWADAVLGGFYELAERDSVALWWYNRARRPALDLDGAGDHYVDAVRDHYHRLGRELWVLDLRNDTGVVCLAAVSRRTDCPVEDVSVGFGADLDGRVALRRAVDELNQSLPVVDTRRPDGSTEYRFADAAIIDWMQTATVATDPYLLPDLGAGAVPVDSLGSRATGRPEQDVATCARLARNVSSHLYTVDVGGEDVGLRVARVIVPGLRHFWRRLGPGRLYETPVALGWIDHRLDETELNPRTIYF
jgi:bacteriocin biosynthesis cyclodehydratase domain-containing protein